MRGSHGQDDFQLIDGNLLLQHSFFHLNAPNGNTGDFEDSYSATAASTFPRTSSASPNLQRQPR